MTAQDRKRDTFEAWVAQHHPAAPLDRIPSRPDDYDGVLAAWTWAAWQAASALPEARPEPVACICKVLTLAPESREVTHVALYRPLEPGTLLYTVDTLQHGGLTLADTAIDLASARGGAAYQQSAPLI